MHSIDIYDTGKDYRGYRARHRHEGFAMASIVAGLIMAVVGFCMVLGGLLDPTAPAAVAIIGANLLGWPALNGLMFVTHRNFGLDDDETKVMDAIHTLPEDKRKQHTVTRKEVKALSQREKDQLTEVIREYRKSEAVKSGLLALTRELKDINNTTKMIEGKS